MERQSPSLNSFTEECSLATLEEAASGMGNILAVTHFFHQSPVLIESFLFFPRLLVNNDE